MRNALLSFAIFPLMVFMGACGDPHGGGPAGTGGEPGTAGAGGFGGEIPLCARDFAEPELPYDETRCFADEFTKQQSAAYTVLCTPVESNCGSTVQYWLTGAEIPCVQGEIGTGELYPFPDIDPVPIVALVDGRQVPFSADGSDSSFVHEVSLTPHSPDASAVLTLCLDETTPPSGLHMLTILAAFPQGGRSIVLGGSTATIRDSKCFQDGQPARLSPTQVPGQGSTWIEHAELGVALAGGNGYLPIEGGRLPLRIHLAGYDAGFGYRADTLLVAMVDELEVPLGDLGFAPRLLAPDDPGAEAIFPVTLEDLPTDGERHRLTFVQLAGYGELAMGEQGEPLPFPWLPIGVTSFDFAEE